MEKHLSYLICSNIKTHFIHEMGPQMARLPGTKTEDDKDLPGDPISVHGEMVNPIQVLEI
jgi:hypothetical protein